MTPEQAALVERETGVPAREWEEHGGADAVLACCEASIADLAKAIAMLDVAGAPQAGLVRAIYHRRIDMARLRVGR